MNKADYVKLDTDVKRIVADATCIELLNNDGTAVPGSLVNCFNRSKAVALRLGVGNSSTMATTMFNEVRTCISTYGYGLWPVNSRFTFKTLKGVQTIIISANHQLYGELEIANNAALISYNAITDPRILDVEKTVVYNADIAFGLDKSNWIPVCEVKDCSVPAEAKKVIPLEQRVVISTGRTLAETPGQAALMICI